MLHHLQEEKMGRLRRSKVQLRCDPAGVHYGDKLTCVTMCDLAHTKSTTLLLQVDQVKPAGSAMERQMGLAVERVVKNQTVERFLHCFSISIEIRGRAHIT